MRRNLGESLSRQRGDRQLSLARIGMGEAAPASVASIHVVRPSEKRAPLSSYFLLFVNLLGYGSGHSVI